MRCRSERPAVLGAPNLWSESPGYEAPAACILVGDGDPGLRSEPFAEKKSGQAFAAPSAPANRRRNVRLLQRRDVSAEAASARRRPRFQAFFRNRRFSGCVARGWPQSDRSSVSSDALFMFEPGAGALFTREYAPGNASSHAMAGKAGPELRTPVGIAMLINGAIRLAGTRPATCDRAKSAITNTSSFNVSETPRWPTPPHNRDSSRSVMKTVCRDVTGIAPARFACAKPLRDSFARIRSITIPPSLISCARTKRAGGSGSFECKRSAHFRFTARSRAVKNNYRRRGPPATTAPAAALLIPARTRPWWRDCAPPAPIVIGKKPSRSFANGLSRCVQRMGSPNPRRRRLVRGDRVSGFGRGGIRRLVDVALGTDPAGSGRVARMLNTRRVETEPWTDLPGPGGAGVPDTGCVFDPLDHEPTDAMDGTGRADWEPPGRFLCATGRAAMNGFGPAWRATAQRGPRSGGGGGQLIFFGDKASEERLTATRQRWNFTGATWSSSTSKPFYENRADAFEGRGSGSVPGSSRPAGVVADDIIRERGDPRSRGNAAQRADTLRAVPACRRWQNQ